MKKLSTIEKVEVVPYNSEWPNIFEEEARLIKRALGYNVKMPFHEPAGDKTHPNDIALGKVLK